MLKGSACTLRALFFGLTVLMYLCTLRATHLGRLSHILKANWYKQAFLAWQL